MATVAIVGRKNVGKSTIFNRLTGMRLSVVHREPGVTRDRVLGEVNWRGKTFDLIDTGGFAPDEASTLANKITKQIEFALRDADLIYFVVDGRSGLVPDDEDIGGRIRKLGKRVFLLVNKIDRRQDEVKSWEFAKLGFENTFLVSAEAGIGFGDFLDETIELFPKLKLVKERKRIPKILILGRPNSGKSTLLNAIVKEERAIVDEVPGTTRDLVNARFTYLDQELEIIDTSGIRRRSRIKEPIEFYSVMRAIRVIDRADVVILIFDATQGIVDQDRHIASLILAKAKGMVLAANKIDLIAKNNRSKVISSTQESLEFLEFVPVIAISAKNDTNIGLLLNQVLGVYQESNKTVDKNVLRGMTDNLKPPPGGSILRLAQIGRRPPVFRATLTMSVKDNYIKYLRSTIRNYFGFAGLPILIKTKIVK